MEQHRETFEKRGVRIVAVSVDPPEVTLKHTRKQGFSFTFLCDPKAEVIRRYDLMHEGAGPGAADISRPAEFLIDPRGNVRWVNLTDDYRVRLHPEEALKVLDTLGVG